MSLAECLAGNPNTPIPILKQLAKDQDADVRGRVAGHPNTPIPVLEQLAKDKEKNVRLSLASHPNTPIPVLKQLAKDKDADVRGRVAELPNAPVPVLEQLAKDKDASVRNNVASNPNTPIPVLEQLAKESKKVERPSTISYPCIICLYSNPNVLFENENDQLDWDDAQSVFAARKLPIGAIKRKVADGLVIYLTEDWLRHVDKDVEFSFIRKIVEGAEIQIGEVLDTNFDSGLNFRATVKISWKKKPESEDQEETLLDYLISDLVIDSDVIVGSEKITFCWRNQRWSWKKA